MKLLATSLVLALAASNVHAAKLAGDEFQYTTAASPGQALNGVVSPAGSSFGFVETSWTTNTTNTSVGSVAATTSAMSYSGSGVNIPASPINSAVQFSSNAANVTNTTAATRTLTTALVAATQPDVYVSFLARFQAGTFTTENFYFYLGTAGTAGNRYDIGFSDVGGATDFGVRATTNGTYAQTSGGLAGSVPNFGTTPATYFIVGKLTKDAGSSTYNRFTIFANPTGIVPDSAGTGSTTVSVGTANSGLSSINTVGFGFTGLDSGDQFQIDNLLIGQTWQDVVTPVPFGVDSTAGLALLGLASAWKLRRRVKA